MADEERDPATDSAAILTHDERPLGAVQAPKEPVPAGESSATAVATSSAVDDSDRLKDSRLKEDSMGEDGDSGGEKDAVPGRDQSTTENEGSSETSQPLPGQDADTDDEEPAQADDEDAPPATQEEDEAAGRTADAAEELKLLGNEQFKAGNLDAALDLYLRAISVAPRRPGELPKLAAIHANRAACLLKMERYEDCVAACDDCLDLEPKYVKALLRRVTALEGLEMFEEAQQDYEDILAEFPRNSTAKEGLARLKQRQKEKEEKLKDEMMDKLKGVGNSLLGHFGLSLDNFKVDQDPKTGGYSINFQQDSSAPQPPPSE